MNRTGLVRVADHYCDRAVLGALGTTVLVTNEGDCLSPILQALVGYLQLDLVAW